LTSNTESWLQDTKHDATLILHSFFWLNLTTCGGHSWFQVWNRRKPTSLNLTRSCQCFAFVLPSFHSMSRYV
jgi:hypothetical protein